MGKKTDSIIRLEADVSEVTDSIIRLEADVGEVKSSVDHRFAAIEERFSAIESSINDRLSAIESSIDDRLTSLETMLLNLTQSSPASGDRIQESEDHVSPVENDSLQNGKRKANGDDDTETTSSSSTKKVKTTNEADFTGDDVGEKLGTTGSGSSAEAGEEIAVRTVTDELINAISLLETPEDLVKFESLLESVKMPIIVETAIGKTLTFEVESSETIKNVKAKIDNTLQILSWHQKLLFGTRLLEEHRTLAYYNIQKGSTLHMMLCREDIQLYVYVITLRGEKIALDVKTSDTVEDVKAKIHKKEGIPPGIQKLLFSGKELIDDKTVLVCKICLNVPVLLTLRLPKAKSTNGVPDKSVGEKTSELVSSESVTKKLVNGIEMLKKSPAPEPNPASNKVEIYIEKFYENSGDICHLEVENSDTIYNVKAKFYKKEMIHLHAQALIYHGRQLRDDETVGSYEIENNSTLHVVLPSTRVCETVFIRDNLKK